MVSLFVLCFYRVSVFSEKVEKVVKLFRSLVSSSGVRCCLLCSVSRDVSSFMVK